MNTVHISRHAHGFEVDKEQEFRDALGALASIYEPQHRVRLVRKSREPTAEILFGDLLRSIGDIARAAGMDVTEEPVDDDLK